MLRNAELPAQTAHDGPHHSVLGRTRMSGSAVINRDGHEPARDRRRRPAATGKVGDVERDCFRIGRMRCPADETCEGAEVAPIIAVCSFRRLCATGVGRSARGDAELGNERIDIAGCGKRFGRPRECGTYPVAYEARKRHDGHQTPVRRSDFRT